MSQVIVPEPLALETSFTLPYFWVRWSQEVGSFLRNTIIQTVFGISLMLLVDTILATRATKQARQRLGRAMDRLELCLRACAGDLVAVLGVMHRG